MRTVVLALCCAVGCESPGLGGELDWFGTVAMSQERAGVIGMLLFNSYDNAIITIATVLGMSRPGRLLSGRSRGSSCSLGHLARVGELKQVWISPKGRRESSSVERPRFSGFV